MMNMRAKSALLALTMVIAGTVPFQSNAVDAPVVVKPTVMSFVSQHKLAFVVMTVFFAIHTRLHTRKKDSFKMDELRADFKEFLDSLNVFDTKTYKQLVYMFDKYAIGLPLKLEDGTTRTKDDAKPNEIKMVKGKVLIQKPFGMYGLFDAYVLSQMKKFTELFPAMAAFYVLLGSQEMAFQDAVKKAVNN
jgi:hypothetical protein